ncbi:uncharacterized protein LAJ45_01126 [Morchella importuna]|uniref:uncharacterized protein n=1 Tax=Morchella importuna TaxID=1174673 RepID=UPI001E8DD00B|nr:uncharacterized protein LAJ45_01126 [Morchella importuna]KAH8154598.1 hypothetical protein LAJ45_01126 [Morchella importuna]
MWGTLNFHLRSEYIEHQQRSTAKQASIREPSATIPKSPAAPDAELYADHIATEAAFQFLDKPHLHSDALSVRTTRGPDYIHPNAHPEPRSDPANSRHQHCTIIWLPKRCAVCHQLLDARSAPANACFLGSEAVGQLLKCKYGLVYHLCGLIHLGVFRRSQ